jgi:hypothetical protein
MAFYKQDLDHRSQSTVDEIAAPGLPEHRDGRLAGAVAGGDLRYAQGFEPRNESFDKRRHLTDGAEVPRHFPVDRTPDEK